MAKVKIHDHEKQTVLKVIKKFEGKQMSVAALAKEAGYNPNRTRFIFDELFEEGKIEKIPVKKFNDKYIRYTYKVVQK